MSPSASPTPSPSLSASPSPNGLSAYWLSDLQKLPAENLLRKSPSPITLSSARQETVAFQVILENTGPTSVTAAVSLSPLKIAGSTSSPVSVQLFRAHYLQIKGLSRLSYETYDERHIPLALQRPYTISAGKAIGAGTWTDRPDHDKSYPDPLPPISNGSSVTVAPNRSQSVWVDLYVPKGTAPGSYTGTLTVGSISMSVTLGVHALVLPDRPTFRFWAHMDDNNLALRFGVNDRAHRDQVHQLAHEHGFDLSDTKLGQDAPPPTEWQDRLTGALYTPARGYNGRGQGVGNQTLSIGPYGSWNWTQDQATMLSKATAWRQWLTANAPATKASLYLIDESSNYALIEQLAGWVKPSGLTTFATLPIPAVSNVPSLTAWASWITVGRTSWTDLVTAAKNRGVSFGLYNGKRPAFGSFAIEDEGTAMHANLVGNVKLGSESLFYWSCCYFNDYQGGRGQTDVWKTAATFSGALSTSSVLGETGWNHSNGDGVLFYPGTDNLYPASSLGLNQMVSSIRAKLIRRALQDLDYLALAKEKKPTETMALIRSLVPEVGWELDVYSTSDPTYVHKGPSWPIDALTWELARETAKGYALQ